MRLLDIIIPQYSENIKTVETALESIATQKNINFDDIGVILINDHSNNIIKSTTLKKYKDLNITYLVNETNMGPGPTRQRGIDLSEALYVTFLDADDVFFNDEVLENIFASIRINNYPNAIFSRFIQEVYDYGKISSFVLKPDRLLCLHGLFIKNSWMKDNDIRFNEKLYHYEDSYFVNLIWSFGDIYYDDTITYIWKYNSKSMTKKNKREVIVDYLDDFLNCAIYLKNKINNFNSDYANNLIARRLIEAALCLESSLFDDVDLKERKEKYEKIVFSLICENINIFDDKKYVMEFYKIKKDEREKNNKDFESYMDFYEFMDYMKNK